MDTIPTRQQIFDKIEEIRNTAKTSDLRSEIITRIGYWLDSLNLPQVSMIFGEEQNTKEWIMSDLSSYPNY